MSQQHWPSSAQPGNGYPMPTGGYGVPPVPPAPPSGPRRGRRAALIAGIGALIVALAAGVAFGYPALKRLIAPGPTPTASGSYLNGAARDWVLDLDQVFPGKGASFWFGPDIEGSDDFMYGPVDAGNSWVMRVQASGEGWMIGVDPETGAVLWKDTEHGYSSCAAGPRPGVLACAVGGRSAANPGPNQIHLAFLNARTGELTIQEGLRATTGFLVADANTIVLQVVAPLGGQLVGYDWSGAQKWSTLLQGANHVPEGRSLRLVDGLATVYSNDRTWAVDAATGATLATGTGFAQPAPARHLLAGTDFQPVTVASDVSVLSGYTATRRDSAGRWGLYRSSSTSLERCDPERPASCWPVSVPGGGYTVSGPPMEQDGHTYAHLVAAAFSAEAVVDLADGRVAYSQKWPGAPRIYLSDHAIQPGPVLAASDVTTGTVRLTDAVAGREVASGTLPGWVPVRDMPGRLLLMKLAGPSADRATAIAAYSPTTSRTGTIASDEAVAIVTVTAPAASPGAEAGRGLPDCPAGTSRIASGELADGWVLVCGAEATPTLWRSSVGGQERSTSSLRWDAAKTLYVGTFPGDGGSEWFSGAPAVFVRTEASGSITASRSVKQVWFASVGSNVSTTGSYGVPVPVANAADQVRYISAILKKSAEARAALVPAVTSVRECSHGSVAGRYASEVETIRAVADNRGALAVAVQSAPVDQVPDGMTLINQLHSAIVESQAADLQYLSWASAVDRSGCGAATEDAANAASDRAGTAKTSFAQSWNSRIAPAYGVPTVARETL